MNTISILAGILSCLLLMLTVVPSTAFSDKESHADEHLLIHHPHALSANKLVSIYQDEASMADRSSEDDDHELEKRRFNAWAGKRNTLTKRRFNAWAGRR